MNPINIYEVVTSLAPAVLVSVLGDLSVHFSCRCTE